MGFPSLTTTAAAGERSFAFFSLPRSSRRVLKAQPLILPSVPCFQSSPILSVSAQVRSCGPISARWKINSSLGSYEENGDPLEDSVPDSPSSSSYMQERGSGVRSPRRNLLVEFTCDSCGARTQRVINRVAFDRGTVFLQCAGCAVYHKLVDNLNLVVEYDLRDE